MQTPLVTKPGLLVAVIAALMSVTLAAGCGSSSGGSDEARAPVPLEAARANRAIAGVSMGAYGALNIGTKHPELFGTIAALGGPVSLEELIRHVIEDNLDVQPLAAIARAPGEDFTFDHLPPYPDRDSRISMFQDLVLAFGNPFLHHPDPTRRYLASDAEPAMLRVDDAYGAFDVIAARGFRDGGDEDENGLRTTGEAAEVPTDVLLLAAGSLATIAPDAPAPQIVGDRALADLDGDGVFDVGDGIVVNLTEPFDDDGDGVFEPEAGETFADLGLDGVAGSGDFGEGNGRFDEDPDLATWRAEDPLTRITGLSAAAIAAQRLYLDVGTEDELGFAAHYDALVDELLRKGLAVAVQDGLSGNCADLPGPDEPILLVRYDGGHIGFDRVDPDDLLNGDPCGTDTVWQRIISMIGFLNESFTDGLFGPGDDTDPPDVDLNPFDDGDVDIDIDFPDLDFDGDVIMTDIASPALARPGEAAPLRPVLIYRPPAFDRTDASFPIVYFLGGYGQEPEDFARVRILLDAFVLTGQLQNVIFAFLPGAGGRQGSFYVDHAVPEAQAPELAEPTSGRYEASILEDLIPAIENDILGGRVRRD